MKNQNTNETFPLRGMFWAGIFSLLVLGGIYLRAESHLRALTATLAQLKAQAGASEQQVAALQHEVDEAGEDIAAVIGGPTASSDENRRNATLAVIARLKAAHDAHPPEPPKKAPPVPVGPRGMIFPELMSDPEYSAAYAVRVKAGLRQTKMPGLLRLGLSEELAEKVIAVLAERELSFEDYRQLDGKAGAGIPGTIAKPIVEETNRQLRQLMGEETYKRYAAMDGATMIMVPNANGNGGHSSNVRSHQTLVADSYTYFIPKLTTRLSYSNSPLQPTQAEQLADLLATNSSGPDDRIYKIMFTDAFVKKTSGILAPTQFEALRQLQAEEQAFALRAQLPKSSELPRNTPVIK